MKITASYIGRNTYEVKVDDHTELYTEPFFNSPEKYTRRIVSLVESFNMNDINVTDTDIWSALEKAAEEAGRYFPNCLTY